MKRTMFSVILMTGLMALSVGAIAQNAPITATQQVRNDHDGRISQEQREQMKQVMENAKEQREELHKQTEQKIRQILTPEQYEHWKRHHNHEMKMKRDDMMKNK